MAGKAKMADSTDTSSGVKPEAWSLPQSMHASFSMGRTPQQHDCHHTLNCRYTSSYVAWDLSMEFMRIKMLLRFCKNLFEISWEYCYLPLVHTQSGDMWAPFRQCINTLPKLFETLVDSCSLWPSFNVGWWYWLKKHIQDIFFTQLSNPTEYWFRNYLEMIRINNKSLQYADKLYCT